MIEATNDFIFIIRDEVEKEKAGMFIPGQGREKPHRGKIISVGELTEDKKIQPDKIAILHKGVGFPIEIDGIEYLVLVGKEVIAVL